MEAQIAIEKRAGVLTEREKEHVSEHFLTSMDEYTKAELSDNAWLKQEVRSAMVFCLAICDTNV
jgi:hypothetical protein